MNNYSIVSVLSGSLINAYVLITIMRCLLGMKKIKVAKFIISVIGLGLYIGLSYMITNSFIRMILLYLVIVTASYFSFYCKKIKKQAIIVNAFIEFMLLLLAEILFLIVLMIFGVDLNASMVDKYFGKFTINIIIIFIFVLFMYLYIKITRKRKNNSSNLGNRYLIIYIIISITIFTLTFYFSMMSNNKILICVINFLAIIVHSIFVLQLFNIKSKNINIKSENDILLENLFQYENLLERQRISSHENKNQLLVIKGMVNKKENIIKYIDTLIDTQYGDNDNLLMKTNRIPSGGLKGLVYYKILTMKDKNILVSLEINNNINKINFNNISIKTNQELCKIVGVFLDNAIQEVENLDKRNINIMFDYDLDKLYIKISNNYKSNNLSQIGEKGYTTKGDGHGYGLRLVKSIIDNNDNFENRIEINGQVFSQILILKIKND